MKCKECNGTGTVHIDIPHACNKVFDLPCWVCGGTAFRGMDKTQVKWYRAQYKVFESLKGKILRAGEVEAPVAIAYINLKNAINKACGRLHITLNNIPFQKATRYGESAEFLRLRAELKEYERRLTAIPVAVAGTLAVAA